MQKNVASQKWIVFAFDRTDNTPKTGNAGNITANLRIDGAGANAVDDTNPTELEDGFYIFDITQTETNGDCILITPASSTADIQVIGVPGVVWTTPANFAALGIESDGDLAKVNLLDGHTAQTADHTSGISAIPTTAMRGTDSAALASVATEARLAELDSANIPADIAAIPTTAMRGTDSAALASVATEARLAELDAANLPSDVAAIPTTAMRGTDSAALASVATEARLAELDAANMPADIDAIPTTAMRGTDSAATATALTTAQTDLTQIKADLPSKITKNTALANFMFIMITASDDITPLTGATVTATRSIDGATFGSCANAVTEVSNGWYKISLDAADLNGDTIALRFTAASANDTNISLVTQP